VWTPRDEGHLVQWVARAGIGPTLPHAESRIAGGDREGYEPGGMGLQLAPGVAVHLTRSIRVTGEYKFTLARPTVDVVDGTATTAVRTHHVAFGLSAGF